MINENNKRKISNYNKYSEMKSNKRIRIKSNLNNNCKKQKRNNKKRRYKLIKIIHNNLEKAQKSIIYIQLIININKQFKI